MESCSGQDIELALPQKVNVEGYDHGRLLIYKHETDSRAERNSASEVLPGESGSVDIAAQQTNDVVSLAWPGKTLAFHNVSRAISTDALRERLERCSSSKPTIVNVTEMGEDAEFRDVHFLLDSDFESHIEKSAQSLRNKGYKVDVV